MSSPMNLPISSIMDKWALKVSGFFLSFAGSEGPNHVPTTQAMFCWRSRDIKLVQMAK